MPGESSSTSRTGNWFCKVLYDMGHQTPTLTIRAQAEIKLALSGISRQSNHNMWQTIEFALRPHHNACDRRENLECSMIITTLGKEELSRGGPVGRKIEKNLESG
jgi:hypothetical protein